MEQEIESANTEPKKEVNQAYADWTLGGISFVESSFFPIITDPFLLGMTIARPHLWLRYAIIASVASVLGGLFGYFLGAVLFDLVGAQLIAFYNAGDLYEKTVAAADKGAFVFTLIGAFTPIPYKLVAVIGGTLHINIFMFILASVIGRFSRFVLVTYISHKFGEYVLAQFNKRLRLVTIAVVAGIALYILMLFV